jgi:hypothetical protein
MKADKTKLGRFLLVPVIPVTFRDILEYDCIIEPDVKKRIVRWARAYTPDGENNWLYSLRVWREFNG